MMKKRQAALLIGSQNGKSPAKEPETVLFKKFRCSPCNISLPDSPVSVNSKESDKPNQSLPREHDSSSSHVLPDSPVSIASKDFNEKTDQELSKEYESPQVPPHFLGRSTIGRVSNGNLVQGSGLRNIAPESNGDISLTEVPIRFLVRETSVNLVQDTQKEFENLSERLPHFPTFRLNNLPKDYHLSSSSSDFNEKLSPELTKRFSCSIPAAPIAFPSMAQGPSGILVQDLSKEFDSSSSEAPPNFQCGSNFPHNSARLDEDYLSNDCPLNLTSKDMYEKEEQEILLCTMSETPYFPSSSTFQESVNVPHDFLSDCPLSLTSKDIYEKPSHSILEHCDYSIAAPNYPDNSYRENAVKLDQDFLSNCPASLSSKDIIFDEKLDQDGSKDSDHTIESPTDFSCKLATKVVGTSCHASKDITQENNHSSKALTVESNYSSEDSTDESDHVSEDPINFLSDHVSTALTNENDQAGKSLTDENDCTSKGLNDEKDCTSKGLNAENDCTSKGLNVENDCTSKGLNDENDCTSKGLTDEIDKGVIHASNHVSDDLTDESDQASEVPTNFSGNLPPTIDGTSKLITENISKETDDTSEYAADFSSNLTCAEDETSKLYAQNISKESDHESKGLTNERGHASDGLSNENGHASKFLTNESDFESEGSTDECDHTLEDSINSPAGLTSTEDATLSTQDILNQNYHASKGLTNESGHASKGLTNESGDASKGLTNESGHASKDLTNESGHASKGLTNESDSESEGSTVEFDHTLEDSINSPPGLTSTEDATLSTQDILNQNDHASKGLNNECDHASKGLNNECDHASKGLTNESDLESEGSTVECDHTLEDSINSPAGLTSTENATLSTENILNQNEHASKSLNNENVHASKGLTNESDLESEGSTVECDHTLEDSINCSAGLTSTEDATVNTEHILNQNDHASKDPTIIDDEVISVGNVSTEVDEDFLKRDTSFSSSNNLYENANNDTSSETDCSEYEQTFEISYSPSVVENSGKAIPDVLEDGSLNRSPNDQEDSQCASKDYDSSMPSTSTLPCISTSVENSTVRNKDLSEFPLNLTTNDLHKNKVTLTERDSSLAKEFPKISSIAFHDCCARIVQDIYEKECSKSDSIFQTSPTEPSCSTSVHKRSEADQCWSNMDACWVNIVPLDLSSLQNDYKITNQDKLVLSIKPCFVDLCKDKMNFENLPQTLKEKLLGRASSQYSSEPQTQKGSKKGAEKKSKLRNNTKKSKTKSEPERQFTVHYDRSYVFRTIKKGYKKFLKNSTVNWRYVYDRYLGSPYSSLNYANFLKLVKWSIARHEKRCKELEFRERLKQIIDEKERIFRQKKKIYYDKDCYILTDKGDYSAHLASVQNMRECKVVLDFCNISLSPAEPINRTVACRKRRVYYDKDCFVLVDEDFSSEARNAVYNAKRSKVVLHDLDIRM